MRRRDFIKSGAVAASSLLVPMAQTCSADAVPQDEIRVALIGVGYQGRVLLNAAMPIPGVRFQALCDIWNYAQNYGQRFLARNNQQVNVYSDYQELLEKEKDLDAVLIATPDFVHHVHVNACLAAGLHVYCEPMLAHTIDDARSILETVRRTGKLLQVGYQRRSNARYRHVYDKLIREAGLAGALSAVQTQWAQEAADLRGWPRRFTVEPATLEPYGFQDMTQLRNWLWFPQFCAGPFCAFVSQQLDICNWFLGSLPTSVMASGGNEFYPDRDCADTVMSVYEYPSEKGTIRASCQMFTATSAGGMRHYEQFLGAAGSIQISENARWTRIGREANAPDWDTWVRRQYLLKTDIPAVHEAVEDDMEVHVSGELELYELPVTPAISNCQAHLENFFAAVRGEAQLNCPADVAFPCHVAAIRALEAIKARATLAIDASEYKV